MAVWASEGDQTAAAGRIPPPTERPHGVPGLILDVASANADPKGSEIKTQQWQEKDEEEESHRTQRNEDHVQDGRSEGFVL